MKCNRCGRIRHPLDLVAHVVDLVTERRCRVFSHLRCRAGCPGDRRTRRVIAGILRTRVEAFDTNYVGQEGRGAARDMQSRFLREIDRVARIR